MHDTILGDTILDSDSSKPVDLDGDQSTISGNVNAETLALEECWQIDMVKTLRDSTSIHRLCQLIFSALLLIECVGVKCLIRDNVVLEKCLQVFLAIFGEEEGVDLRTKLLKCPVGWGKQSSSLMWCFLDSFKETGLRQAKLKCRELAREELDDLECGGRWKQDGVDSVDDSVCAELPDESAK